MTREEAIKNIKRLIGFSETLDESISTLFPELKENEDERIIEQIKFAVMQIPSDREDTKKECLAWLEKQKEQKPTEDWREKRKEECPFRRNLDNNLYGCERYAGLISECNGICSWVVDYPKLKEIQDKKEQKPYEPKNWPADKNNLTQEQQPAEWSEEDEDKLMDILEMIKYTDELPPTDIPSCTGHLHLSNEYKEKLSSWLKTRLKSFQPQSKQEWSEEDKHRCKDAIYFLETAKKHYADTSEIELTIDWLKSLRPSWKPSEEQMAELNKVRTLNPGLDALYQQLKNM